MGHTFDTKVKIPATANFAFNANPATGTISISSDVTLVTIGIIYNAGANDRLGGAPTLGGVAFTQADQTRGHPTSPEAKAELWYLTSNIPTGTQLISIPNNPTSRTLDAFVSTFKASAGNTSELDVAAGTGTLSSNPTIRLDTTANGDAIIGVVASGANSWSPTAQSGTVIYNEDPSTWGGGGQYILQETAGTIFSAWIQGSDDWGSVAAAFKEVSAGTTKSISDTGTGNDLFTYPRTLPSGSFPNLARLLDDFNRESLGSNWTVTVGQPAIVDNKFVGLTSGTIGNTGNEAEWNGHLFGSPVAWYITIGNLQPSGTSGNDIYIRYDRISSTGTMAFNVYQIYDTLIDRIQFFGFSPTETIYDTGSGVDSAFTYSQRSSVKVGVIHQPNGYATVYLDRGNGWEAIGSGFYNGSKFATGTVRLKLLGYSEDGSDILVPTVTLDDFYFSTLEDSAIFVTGSVSGVGSGSDDISQISNSLSVSDVSSGLDSVLLLLLKSLSDIGLGSDDLSIQASLSTIETASGQEALSLQVSFSLVEVGTGVDSPEIGVSLNVNDTVLGGDFIDLSALLSILETALATDDLSQLSVYLPVSETGSGLEALILSATLSVSDMGLGTDEISVITEILRTIQDVASGLDNVSVQVSLSASEIGSGQDTISIQATFDLSDSGSGVDSPEVGASLGVTDTALGGDFFDLFASLAVSESGTASDLLQLLASLSVSDTGSGSDAINVFTGVVKSIADSGLGSDDVSISVSLSVNDDGTGTDALIISVSIAVLDNGLGTDNVSVLQTALKQIIDSASGSDSLTISASLNVGETSFGIDDPAIQVLLGLVDSGEGLDSPDISASLTITDTASATDIISIIQTMLILISDSGLGSDAITNVTASIPVDEIGLGSDDIGQILASLLVTDFGTGVDVVIKYDSTTNILTIEFILTKPKITFGLAKPLIWLEDLFVPSISITLKSNLQ